MIVNSNLPVEVKRESFFKRIFNFLKRTFGREEKCNSTYIVNTDSSDKTNAENLKGQYKVENLELKNEEVIKRENQRRKLQEIIQIIENNPDSLEKLDISKLEIIDNYYAEKIAENKLKIAKLKLNN